jgi:hypothetical protein
MKDNTIVFNKFKLDRYSPLVDDALLLNIDLKKYRDVKAPLFQATIIGLFENSRELIILFYLPALGQRLTEIVINHNRYPVQIHDEDGFVHKYVVIQRFKPGKLDVSEYIFIDDSLKRSTFSVKEEHVFGILNDQYYYDSKKYFQTQLIGELFHDVIDMSTVKDRFNDLLGRPLFYRDISSLKAKSIKLYYVAFNLFDQQYQRYFVPDSIVEMKVSYLENRYVFQAKKIPQDQVVNPETDGQRYPLEKKETVAKELRKIESGEKSDWNIIQNFFTYKQYRYQSIYKLTDKVKSAQKEAKGFSYILVIGPKYGYRLSKEVFKRGKVQSFDFEETTLSQIKIFHLTYQERGHRYSVPVQSLVYESDKKSRLPRFKHRIQNFFRTLGKIVAAPFKFVFGAGGVILKIIRFIIRHWKIILISLGIGVLVYFGIQIYRWF